jgi:hypothetical protein
MKWFTTEEAIKHYNTTLYKVEKARREAEPKDVKRDKNNFILISESYLNKHFEWHRLSEKLNKKSFTLRINDFYWWLCKHKWSKEKAKEVSKSQYTKFIVEFFKLMTDKIIKENFIFIFPYKLGSVYIKKFPVNHHKSRSINKSYKDKTGKSIAYSNKHTFGNRFVLKYDRMLTNYPNAGITSVRPAVYFRRTLFKEIMRRSENGQKTYNAH